jgi:hypothetical protein
MRGLRAFLRYHRQRAQGQWFQPAVRMDAGALAQRRQAPLQGQVQPFSAPPFYQRRWTLQAKGAILGPNGAPCQ